MNQKHAQRLNKILNSNIFSVLLLLGLVVVLGAVAYYVTESLQPKPDFGGMVIVRQAQMDIDNYDDQNVTLTQSMILEFITAREILEPIGKRYGWNVDYKEMVRNVDVKERLASSNSFIVLAHTMDGERSIKVAYALAQAFLDDYRHQWTIKSCKSLILNTKKVEERKRELKELKEIRQKFQERKELRPLNTEIEMTALNEQLVEAQKKFLEAYGEYVSRMEIKRQELQLEIDIALQIYTSENVEVRIMKRKLKALDAKCAQIKKQLTEQKPNLYRMTTVPQKLEGLPFDVVYFFENVQNLQQIKLALMLDSIIEEKSKMLEKEKERGRTLSRLINSKSCDVFIRGVER